MVDKISEKPPNKKVKFTPATKKRGFRRNAQKAACPLPKSLCINEGEMKETGSINYVEIPSTNLEATKNFFAEAFGWSFVDYGPDYVAIEGAGLDGGFYKSEKVALSSNGSVLIVLYSNEIEETLIKAKSCGGSILKEIFSFPGGRRFHFSDPTGNEYAVWSE
jgi:hypothetical protein